ncbi:MAG: hypothetical protein DM484_18640 [Candidatus Methylumidiphilus alinenensis]|uniref:Uncharacterized protein n=1 Tax=Candidatus Methylumidiphilus alinenensis TaxID=2202197 RepID=A0A2W4SS20_9GAMM|nr:MAG: hypothetical protein DM484_18640 [Candidatus Methylumidiphilus alinenensis]
MAIFGLLQAISAPKFHIALTGFLHPCRNDEFLASCDCPAGNPPSPPFAKGGIISIDDDAAHYSVFMFYKYEIIMDIQPSH